MNDSFGVGAVKVKTNTFNNPGATTHDPYRVRWGFNGVLRGKILSARDCGVNEVPFGEFFPIRSFSTPKEHHSIDYTKPREMLEIVTADDAQHILELALAGAGAQDELNWGFQTGFEGEQDTAKMIVITKSLLPDLSLIRTLAEKFKADSFIGKACPGQDEFDQRTRETCPTCWANWLQSPACEMYMQYRVQHGMDVSEESITTGTIELRNVRPTMEELQKARDLMLKAFQIGLDTIGAIWQEIATGVEKGTRKDVNKLEMNYRKDLHKSAPGERQLSEAVAYANATKDTSSSDAIVKLVEMQQEQNKTQNEFNQLLTQVIGGRLPEQPTAAPAVDLSMFACADKNKSGADCQGKVVKIVDKKPFCAVHPAQKPVEAPEDQIKKDE